MILKLKFGDENMWKNTYKFYLVILQKLICKWTKNKQNINTFQLH